MGLEINGDIGLNANFSLVDSLGNSEAITFGVRKNNAGEFEAFLEHNAVGFKVDIDADLSNFQTNGKLGFIDVGLTDNGSQVGVDFFVNLNNGSVTEDVNANLNFIIEPNFGDNAVLPPSSATLNLDWNLNNLNASPQVAFNNINLATADAKNIIIAELLDSAENQIGNLTEIIGEFDSLLAQLEDTLNSDIFELYIPFLGDALSKNLDATSFITNIRNSLSSKFQNIITDSAETLVAELNKIPFIKASLVEEDQSEDQVVITLGLEGGTGFETNLAPDLGFLDSLGLDSRRRRILRNW